MSYQADPNDNTKSVPKGLPSDWTTSMNTPYQTGSVMMQDGDVIEDASGHDRITFTDAGALELKDESGNSGYVLNTDLGSNFLGNITASSNISASGYISASTIYANDGYFSGSSLYIGGEHVTATR